MTNRQESRFTREAPEACPELCRRGGGIRICRMKSALLWAGLLWPASMLAADSNVERVLPLAQLIREALE